MQLTEHLDDMIFSQSQGRSEDNIKEKVSKIFVSIHTDLVTHRTDHIADHIADHDRFGTKRTSHTHCSS